MAGEREWVREVKSAGLLEPTTSGKVPPEIRALHRGETQRPAGHDDREPPEEGNRSRLGCGLHRQAAFAPGCRTARRRGLLLGAHVPHPCPPSTPIAPQAKVLVRETCASPTEERWPSRTLLKTREARSPVRHETTVVMSFVAQAPRRSASKTHAVGRGHDAGVATFRNRVCGRQLRRRPGTRPADAWGRIDDPRDAASGSTSHEVTV